mmetsp:Transcript_6540/g.10165  ORF Transcript_6540/g.10165 Transcript_6540/m.10165 type:complete len:182 (+) Transcript_6540:696-1241(+)
MLPPPIVIPDSTGLSVLMDAVSQTSPSPFTQTLPMLSPSAVTSNSAMPSVAVSAEVPVTGEAVLENRDYVCVKGVLTMDKEKLSADRLDTKRRFIMPLSDYRFPLKNLYVTGIAMGPWVVSTPQDGHAYMTARIAELVKLDPSSFERASGSEKISNKQTVTMNYVTDELRMLKSAFSNVRA